MKRHYYYIYILTNHHHNVIYIGLTNDLIRRIWEHKHKITPGFTNRYNVDKLVYHESFRKIQDAIAREKQLKAGSRQKKLNLINSMNPEWTDLYQKLLSQV